MSLLADEFEVERACSGRDALEILRRDPRFDAILCDLVMPDVSGTELFAELERSAPELARRVIFATGGTFGGPTLAPLAGAKNPRLEKPFELEQLRAVLRRTVAAPPAARAG